MKIIIDGQEYNTAKGLNAAIITGSMETAELIYRTFKECEESRCSIVFEPNDSNTLVVVIQDSVYHSKDHKIELISPTRYGINAVIKILEGYEKKPKPPIIVSIYDSPKEKRESFTQKFNQYR